MSKTINPIHSLTDPETGKEWAEDKLHDWRFYTNSLCHDLTLNELRFLADTFGGIRTLIDACTTAGRNGSAISISDIYSQPKKARLAPKRKPAK